MGAKDEEEFRVLYTRVSRMNRQEKGRLTVLTIGPNPLTMLSTSSNPNVRLRLPHFKNEGSPCGPPSTEPEINRQRSSSRRYASLAAGLNAMLVGFPTAGIPSCAASIDSDSVGVAAASCSGAGTSTLKDAGGRAARRMRSSEHSAEST